MDFWQIFDVSLPDLDEEARARLKALKNEGTLNRDERFPSTNQAMHCWNRYNEWVLCLQQSTEKKCQPMRFMADKICPEVWTEEWDDQRDAGTFSGIGNRFEKAHGH